MPHICNAWCHDEEHAQPLLVHTACDITTLRRHLHAEAASEGLEVYHIRPAPEADVATVYATQDGWTDMDGRTCAPPSLAAVLRACSVYLVYYGPPKGDRDAHTSA